MGRVLRNINVQIFTDGGSQWGIGHLRRSSVLAMAMRERGIKVYYSACSKEAKAYMQSLSVHTDIFDSPDLYIFDLPYDIKNCLENISDWSVPKVALDYFGDTFTDLVISIYEHTVPVPKGRRFSGLEYAIIRPDILKFRNQAHRCFGANRALVVLGGADINRMGYDIASQIASHGWQVDLIEGPAVREGQKMKTCESITVHHNPKNFPELLCSCDWAISNGGSTMLELMALSKPVFVVPQTDAEANLAEIVYAKGGILGWSYNKILIPSSGQCNKIASVAAQIIDGNGASRIIDLIFRHVLS